MEPGLELYWGAFWDLTTCRSVGMAAGPIPWTAIAQWGTIRELSPDQQSDLEYLVAQMDAAYLKWSTPKSDK